MEATGLAPAGDGPNPAPGTVHRPLGFPNNGNGPAGTGTRFTDFKDRGLTA